MQIRILLPFILASASAFATGVSEQEFAAALPAPGTIVYTEQTDLKFEDFRKTPASNLLGLFPGYQEPITPHKDKNGTVIDATEELTMYIAKTRMVLSTPSAQIAGKLPRLLDVNNLTKLDPSVKHKMITPADLITKQVPGNVTAFSWCEGRFDKPKKETKMDHLKGQPWCEGRNVACVESCYVFPSLVQNALSLIKGATGGDKEDDGVGTQSEVRVFASEAEYAKKQPLSTLTGLNTPVVGVVEQNVFYLNLIAQYSKLVVVLQQHPTDSNATVMTAILTVGIKTRSLKKYAPALGAALKQGYSKFPGLLSGIPRYFGQTETKALSDILSN